MDIFRFINSRDIREYLKSRDYSFTSPEAARLIYQCRCATIKEKHAAWQELIQTMPDCEIAERPNTASHESLHQFLKEYIRTEDEILDWFFLDEKDSIYNCEFWEYAMWCPGGGYFDSFQRCPKAYTDQHLGNVLDISSQNASENTRCYGDESDMNASRARLMSAYLRMRITRFCVKNTQSHRLRGILPLRDLRLQACYDII